MTNIDKDEKTVTTEEARQGRSGMGVIYVLVIGLILALVAWGGAELYGVWLAQDAPADGCTTAPPAQNGSAQPAG